MHMEFVLKNQNIFGYFSRLNMTLGNEVFNTTNISILMPIPPKELH